MELYLQAGYDALHILHDEYRLKIPIYITENGVPNCNEEIQSDGMINDKDRIIYLEGFLDGVHQAMEEGIDVRGYYVWSLMDNWEWAGGYIYRYGLLNTDVDTQKRIWKDSAY